MVFQLELKKHIIIYINVFVNMCVRSGVKSVEINRKINKITVTGNVEPKRVLHKVKNTGKFAEFWPFVPYEVVSYPYAAGVYNKKAPSGFVRNAPAAYSTGTDSLHDKYVQMFSDDNPNASCSIM